MTSGHRVGWGWGKKNLGPWQPGPSSRHGWPRTQWACAGKKQGTSFPTEKGNEAKGWATRGAPDWGRKPGDRSLAGGTASGGNFGSNVNEVSGGVVGGHPGKERPGH